jgi:murein L,D-transpeptidase YafK
LVVSKSARLIQLFEHAKPAKTANEQLACWKVGLGFQPVGHKTREGDGKTPEGWYRTSDKPQSNFYGAIAIHYPNTSDAQMANTEGRIDKATFSSIRFANEKGTKPPQTSPLGGEILVHGGGSSSDWTLGCIAMEDAELDLLRAALPKNKAVEILILP